MINNPHSMLIILLPADREQLLCIRTPASVTAVATNSTNSQHFVNGFAVCFNATEINKLKNVNKMRKNDSFVHFIHVIIMHNDEQ